MMDETMPRKMKIVMAVIIMMCGCVQLEAKQIINGSFEADGQIADINKTEPNGWTDVNMPGGGFGGYVYYNWSTDEFYSLTLTTHWYGKVEVGDIMTITQYVDLWDANQIVFDVKLETFPAAQWDSNKRTAIMILDDQVIWQKNVNGEYLNQVIPVSAGKGIHKLTLALRSNVDEDRASSGYFVRWDNFRFDLKCNGQGFKESDFNGDCMVNGEDYAILAEKWLEEVPWDDEVNLYKADDFGIINFLDFAIYAKTWVPAKTDLNKVTDNWLYEVDANDPNNLFRSDNLGIVDYNDLAILLDQWLDS